MEQTNQQEKILYQYIMSSRAYRRGMIIRRSAATAVIAGGLFGLCAIRVMLGILLGSIIVFFGAILIVTALGGEQTYTVYNTRLVIKRRGDDSRKSIPLGNILSVKTKTAFYEKDLGTATIYIKAKVDGKVKRFRMRHVFDCKQVADFLQSCIGGGSDNAERV